MKTLKELSKKGSNKFAIPECDVPDIDIAIEAKLRRGDIELPDVNEVTLIRHFLNLSHKNYGVDRGFYPLGSCTMKYNPKVSEDIAERGEFRLLHPLLPEKEVQGALRLMWELSEYLKEITGMDAFTLQPAAGAHGEFTGIRIIREYFKDKGERRTNVIVPDSAHGTNPASSSMGGFNVIEIPSRDGIVDPDSLTKVVDEHTAALMLTNPNTVGLFERHILTISEILKEKGALLYYDGANLNPLLGIVRPGDMGFDVVHINLHKTFSTPHGGGGPGSGPLGVKSFLQDYLPHPIVEKKGSHFYFKKPEKSIGKISSFYGNFMVFLKAYIYIRMLGYEGLKRVAEISVLNANYVKEKLKHYFPPAVDTIFKHECVLSGKPFRKYGIRTFDIAKRLMDYGFHPPTIYFPKIVDEALMIEPTETETKETLDEFISAMINIAKESTENPEIVKKAPHSTEIQRPDEVKAARQPRLKW
ncbi:aminomethyl-transferring glycine dehydrogenase subunit GcvPB [Candidatus Sumerlaeota bacterium]|nr:aminomethyl-transferring glycine dehydrogenase subunit GcvPB [Candidatus Sumerlaeota bacterium]